MRFAAEDVSSLDRVTTDSKTGLYMGIDVNTS